ncbi:MAG: phosphatase PAP2 family protein [Terriglobales bacterium]
MHQRHIGFSVALLLSVLCGTATPQSTAASDESCWAATRRDFQRHAVQMWRGIQGAPGGAVTPTNLKWEIPIAAATAVLITRIDAEAAGRIRSEQVAGATETASNALLGSQFGIAVLSYTIGCAAGKPQARDLGLTTLAGLGFAIGSDLLLKAAFNREYPNKWNGEGRFWAGGKSFPSGHAAAAWGMASAFAARKRSPRWMKWAAYASAAGAGMLRFPARKHFPSDILIGGTLGYVTGRWVGEH